MLEIPKRESQLRRWSTPMAWGVGAIAMAGLAWWLFVLLVRGDTGSDRPLLVEVERGSVTRTVAAYGKLLPRENAIIQAGVEGTVEQILVYPGAAIEPGQAIVRLVNVDLERRLDDARTAALEARANLELAQARAERELLKAQNEQKLAESDAELAQQKVQMLEVLLQQKSISRLEFLQAQMEKTRAELRAELGLKNIEVTRRATEAELRATRLQRESAERALESARTDLDRLTIRADRAGLLTVLGSDVKVGALVQRGQVLGQIAAPDSLYAEMFVSASDAVVLIPGQPVDLRVQGRALPATLTRVDPSVADGQVRVIADLDDGAAGSLRANVDVSARITVAEVSDAIRIRRPTRISASATRFETFIESNGYLVSVTLPLGVVGDDYMQILHELTPGQRVAIAYPEAWAGQQRVPVKEI